MDKLVSPSTITERMKGDYLTPCIVDQKRGLKEV